MPLFVFQTGIAAAQGRRDAVLQKSHSSQADAQERRLRRRLSRQLTPLGLRIITSSQSTLPSGRDCNVFFSEATKCLRQAISLKNDQALQLVKSAHPVHHRVIPLHQCHVSCPAMLDPQNVMVNSAKKMSQ